MHLQWYKAPDKLIVWCLLGYLGRLLGSCEIPLSAAERVMGRVIERVIASGGIEEGLGFFFSSEYPLEYTWWHEVFRDADILFVCLFFLLLKDPLRTLLGQRAGNDGPRLEQGQPIKKEPENIFGVFCGDDPRMPGIKSFPRR